MFFSSSPEIPEDLCDPNPCENSGVCVGDGEEFTCNCDDTDYVGDLCDTQRICSTLPCQNGGSCVGEDDGINYTCDCSGTGFTGDTCQTGEGDI